MRETHIIKLLDEKPAERLSEQEIAGVEAHVAQCSDCKRAYDAARITGALIVARASASTAVGPFFKTRVTAAIRERHLAPEEAAAFMRMWRAAGALVSTMIALVMILAAVTIFTAGPDSRIQPTPAEVSQNIYSPEYVVLDQGDHGDDDLTYDEAAATMYELEDSDGQQSQE